MIRWTKQSNIWREEEGAQDIALEHPSGGVALWIVPALGGCTCRRTVWQVTPA